MPDYPSLPERPAAWDPDTPVLGSPELARLVWMITNSEPDLKRKLRKVQAGPTPGVIERLQQSGFGPELFDQTTLMGQYDKSNQQMFIHPDLINSPRKPAIPSDEPTLIQTLLHEMRHVRGASEPAARMADLLQDQGQLADLYRRSQR